MPRDDKPALDLANETRAAEALRDALWKMPDMDEATVRDMIEGETALRENIGRVMDFLIHTDAMVEALDKTMAEFSARKRRYVERRDYLRSTVEQAMVVGEIKKLELPAFTLSLSHRPGGVIVTDETQIPSQYWRQPDPEVDKSKIGKALKAGAEIPGTTLGNGTVSLSVHRS